MVTIVAAAVAACSPKSDPPTQAPPPPQQPRDAGVDGITVIGSFDPASNMHLDDDGTTGRITPSRPKNRQGRPVDITLKSTPPGAVAAVDGVPIGHTPAYWFGEADGREHEFTFTRPGYAGARFRFVPVTSGVVHATLEAVTMDPTDGGLGPEIAPTFSPDASVAPPQTILAPVDATVRTAPVPPPVIDAGAPLAPVAVDAADVGPAPGGAGPTGIGPTP